MSQFNSQPKSDPSSVAPSIVAKTSHNAGGTSTSRLFAVLAYMLPVIGGIIGLLADGSNPLTRFHARQSIGAALALVLSFLTWVAAGYLISLIPIAGPIVAIAMFSLVIALAIFLAANWLVNLAVVALRGEERAIPFADRVAARLFGSEPVLKKSA